MIKQLAALRGIFILFIFLHHMSVFPGGGGMGVAFFFVLGGFSMTLGYHEKILLPTFHYGQYIARRAIKFYPLHWLCLLASIPLVIDNFTWPTFLVNAALLQSWVPNAAYYFSYNAVSWYLANTMFFAIIFPFVYRWKKRSSKMSKWVVFICVVIAYLLILFFANGLNLLYINPLVRSMDFVFGICLGLFYLKSKEKAQLVDRFENSPRLGQVVVFASILLLVAQACIMAHYSCKIAPFYWLLIAVVIYVSSMMSECNGVKNGIMTNNLLVKFGECSFTFFMIHQIVIKYVYLLVKPYLASTIENRYILQLALIIVCFFVTLVLCVLIHNYFVKPITACITKKIQPFTTVR